MSAVADLAQQERAFYQRCEDARNRLAHEIATPPAWVPIAAAGANVVAALTIAGSTVEAAP